MEYDRVYQHCSKKPQELAGETALLGEFEQKCDALKQVTYENL